jgi:hypothetical protein
MGDHLPGLLPGRILDVRKGVELGAQGGAVIASALLVGILAIWLLTRRVADRLDEVLFL